MLEQILALGLLSLLAGGPSPAHPSEAAAVPDTTERTRLPPEWQQEIHYTVEARLDEGAETLRAAQTVRYRNASPDTLRSLYFHLYLNAFRPNSVWARTEQRDDYDFQSLEEPEYGFERLRSVRLVDGPGAGTPAAPSPAGAGTELVPGYPRQPDSTVVRLDLPAPLPPGEAVTLHMRWDARPATLCRRQCRRGRSYDFAQWYPRAAVYDGGGWQAHPLHPQGEFYGEFATYDVTLDLAEDQVVGATGVPVEGDPGWRPGDGSPVAEPLLQRGWYPEPADGLSPAYLDEAAAQGRRRVRFYAEDVHHFGWSTSPDYRYEGGVFARGALPDVAVHVLFRPGDEGWDEGVAVERTIRALSWLETVFRPYPYPQLTNLHRLEGGGTEFPMVIMDGSAAEGLIVHEGTHQYAHGILANNEWREAWLDEGLTSFLSAWYAEEHGGGDVWSAQLEGLGRLEGIWNDPSRRPDPLPRFARNLTIDGDTLPAPLPVATTSEAFANYAQYGAMSYTKPAAVFYMLRELVGKETMRRILRTYYDRYEFRHVNEAAFRSVAEEVSGRRLDWFFDQWLHSTGVLDYALEEVTFERTEDGRVRTTVRIVRQGDLWMPMDLAVGRVTRRLEGRQATRTVEVLTDEPPAAVELDPDVEVLDVDRDDQRVTWESCVAGRAGEDPLAAGPVTCAP